jgi:pilus assembly protein Flp/PilA
MGNEGIRRYRGDEQGATAAEYAILLAVLGTAVAGAAVILAASVSGAMNGAGSLIQDPTAGAGSGSVSGSGSGNGGSNGKDKNPNACPGGISCNGNTTPGVPGSGKGH